MLFITIGRCASRLELGPYATHVRTYAAAPSTLLKDLLSIPGQFLENSVIERFRSGLTNFAVQAFYDFWILGLLDFWIFGLSFGHVLVLGFGLPAQAQALSPPAPQKTTLAPLPCMYSIAERSRS